MSIFTNPASRSADEAAEYTAAIVALLGERDPVEVLETTPRALDRVFDGLTEQQIGTREAPGKWSIRHVLRHLADSDIVWAWRLRMVLAHDRPRITGYDQDLWADQLHYDRANARESVREFAVLRAGNLRLLGQTTAADRERVGVHAERGEESVAHMMRMYAGHDLLHLRQIERIRTAIARHGAEAGG